MFKEGAEKKIKKFLDFAGFRISLSFLQKFFMRILGECGQKYYSAIFTMCSLTNTHTHKHTHTHIHTRILFLLGMFNLVLFHQN